MSGAGGRAYRLSEHLRKYLLAYVVLVIILAIPIGYEAGGFIKAHKPLMKDMIITLAILTLLPSMIQLRAERFGPELSAKKLETIVALVIIFAVGPFTAMAMAGRLPSKPVAIGFVAANSVPASSASIAYVLLAEGNIEFATLLAIISILGALGTVPAYVGFYARSVHVSVPLGLLGESVGLALVTPFVVGQVTRYYLVKRRARSILRNHEVNLPCKRVEVHASRLEEAIAHLEDALECIEGRISRRIKPYLSLWTMLAMLVLVGTLIAAKASLLVAKPELAAEIIGFQVIVYAVIIAALAAATLAMRLSYEDHSAMAFIALTKNESVAAAVSVMAIGTAAAIPAALVPAIQPVMAILYLWALPGLARALRMRRAQPQPGAKAPEASKAQPVAAR
ncbi:MAG: bile acid:sodium symporter [Desulfurococcales archaeon]|nr:bile acid:sodium symporter [Desulfurococcales archaeon]